MGDSRMGGLLPHFFVFMFFHTSTYSPLKSYRKCYAFVFFELLVGKLVKNSLGKCSNEHSKSAVADPFPSCYWPKLTKMEFSRLFLFVFFLYIIVKIGEKYVLKHFFNQLEANLTVKKRKNAVVDPHCAIP